MKLTTGTAIITPSPKKWLVKKTTLSEFIASLLVILFVYTGINKMMDFDTFIFQLGRSPFVQQYGKLIAWTLPAGELLIAIALIWKRTRLIGFYASFFIMSLFTGYIYAMLHYSYYLPCSCGGILASMSWEQHLVFNAVFTLLSLTGVFIQTSINNSNNNLKNIVPKG